MTLIVVVSAIVATAYTLWRLRTEAIDRHFEAASMYARAFENHLTQSFNVVNLTIVNIGGAGQTGETLAMALRQAPYFRSLALLDGADRIVASSDPLDIGAHVARDAFLPQTSAPMAVLRVGPPWTGRDFHGGTPATPEQPAAPEAPGLIPVLRDVEDKRDVWVTALAAVNPDYFLNYYSRSVDAAEGAVDLLRYDGVLLLSTDVSRKPGSRDGDDRIVSRIAQEEFGRFEQSRDDGRVVLTAYRASRNYPFIVVVHLDKEQGLAVWRQEAERTVGIVATVLLATLALARLYFVRLGRISREQHAYQERLRLAAKVFDTSSEAIIVADAARNILTVNKAFTAITGYMLEEVVGLNPRLLASGKHDPAFYAAMWQAVNDTGRWDGEIINRRKNGEFYAQWLIISRVQDEAGNVANYVAIAVDITERKQSERRMQELSQHLVVMQESARRRLSGELHDRTSPNLAAIVVNLDIVDDLLADEHQPVLSDRLADIRALLDDTASSIREISADLRPPILDYAGLADALASYARQFSRRTGIAVEIDCAQCRERLKPELESVLFRIVQEALTNCAKHSRAAAITVALRLDGDTVVLTVSDDGVGFNPDLLGKTTHTGGLGILTMREMTEFSGGTFRIESCPDQGTRIHVNIKAEQA